MNISKEVRRRGNNKGATNARRTAGKQKSEPELMGADFSTELARCATDFWYWASTYIKVYSKRAAAWVPFEAYPGQRSILEALLAGEWQWVVKSRRLGATTAILLYDVHRTRFTEFFRVGVTSQDIFTARKIVRMFKQLERTMPDWMRLETTFNNTTEVEWVNGSGIYSTPPGERATRSDDLNHLFCDEAAFFAGKLYATLDAGQATLEDSGGLATVVSTSDGGGDEFHGGYLAAREGRSRFQARFLRWDERPDRDEAWYERETRHNRHIYGYMQRNHPRDDQECFDVAGGRVFRCLSRERHFTSLEVPQGAKCYRALDFGNSEQHPFCCVWLWHDASASPGLTFEPDCDVVTESESLRGRYASGLDQLFAYRRHDDTGRPIKMNDDLPDALRYAVTHYMMRGRVHVYRVLMIRPDTTLPINPLEHGRRVLELSGFVPHPRLDGSWSDAAAEKYEGTVADPSAVGMIRLFQAPYAAGGLQMSVSPARPMSITREGRKVVDKGVEAGIAWLEALLDGTMPFGQKRSLTSEEEYQQRWTQNSQIHGRMRVARTRCRRKRMKIAI